MYGSRLDYVPITTKRQEFWGKMDHGIGGGMMIGLCLLLMAQGLGYPWWSSLFLSVPVAALLNWAIWKKEAHILRLGGK